MLQLVGSSAAKTELQLTKTHTSCFIVLVLHSIPQDVPRLDASHVAMRLHIETVRVRTNICHCLTLCTGPLQALLLPLYHPYMYKDHCKHFCCLCPTLMYGDHYKHFCCLCPSFMHVRISAGAQSQQLCCLKPTTDTNTVCSVSLCTS